MKIQGIVSDVRQQLQTVGRNYQGAFKAYKDAQRKALHVVTSGGQSLANTEIGAAKNIFASARASFERARTDGLRQLAGQPQSYLPKGRAQLISAYKSSIDLLVKTGSELNEVMTAGYRNVLGELSGATEKTVTAPAKARKTASPSKSATTTAKSETQAAGAEKKAAAPRKRAPRKQAAASTPAKTTDS